jgi:hypothetical protein
MMFTDTNLPKRDDIIEAFYIEEFKTNILRKGKKIDAVFCCCTFSGCSAMYLRASQSSRQKMQEHVQYAHMSILNMLVKSHLYA